MDFDYWFGQFTRCPKCHTSDVLRRTASNAWHTQQGKIDDIEKELTQLRSVLRQIGDLAQLESDQLIQGRIMATSIFALLNNIDQTQAEMRVNAQIIQFRSDHE